MKHEQVIDHGRRIVQDRRFQIAVIIFLAALLPRLMFMEHGLWQDEGRALTIGQNVLQGDGFTFRDKTMQQHPFMFYILLALSFLFLGATTFTGTLLVNTLGALTAVLVYILGEELYNRSAGIAGGVFMAVAPIHWTVSERVLTDVPVTFFMMLAATLFILAERRDSRRLFYIAAVATALAALTKINGLIVVPVFGLYLLYKHGLDTFKIRRYSIGIGIFTALFAVWELRNLVTFGHTVALRRGLRVFWFISGGSGSQFTVGNQDPLFYVANMGTFLGLPAFFFLLAGFLGIYLYGTDRWKDVIAWNQQTYAVLAAGLILLAATSAVLPFAEFAALTFFLLGTAAVFLFVRDRSAFPLLYLLVVFTVYQLKTYNLLRYFLPFAPMALVVAGYGVDRAVTGVRSLAGKEFGLAAFATILAVSIALTYPVGAAHAASGQNSFTGLKEAGAWLHDHTDKDDVIMATSVNQIAWYADRDDVRNIWAPANQSTVDAYVQEHDVAYIEWDIWEPLIQKYSPYAPQYYIDSPHYRPVHVQRRNGRPYLIIFQPVNLTN